MKRKVLEDLGDGWTIREGTGHFEVRLYQGKVIRASAYTIEALKKYHQYLTKEENETHEL